MSETQQQQQQIAPVVIKRPRGRPKGSTRGPSKKQNTGKRKSRISASTYTAISGRMSTQETSERVDKSTAAKNPRGILPPMPQTMEDRLASTQLDVDKIESSIETRQNMLEKHEEELNALTLVINQNNSRLNEIWKTIIDILTVHASSAELGSVSSGMKEIFNEMDDIKKLQHKLADASVRIRSSGRTDRESIAQIRLRLDHLAADLQVRFFHYAYSTLEAATNPEHQALVTGQNGIIKNPF